MAEHYSSCSDHPELVEESFFFPGATLKEEGRCFDKLSTVGVGEVRATL